MRVVLVNRYFLPDQSATSRMASELAGSLMDKATGTPDEIEVVVVASRQMHDDASERLPARETVAGVRIHRVATTRFGRGRLAGRLLDYLSFYVTAAAAITRLARRGDVVIACTDPPLLSILAAPICRLRGARLVTWIQDLFPEVATALEVIPPSPGLNRLLQRARDASLRSAAINVVLGSRMAEHLIGRGIPRERVRIVANWADGALIRPVPREANPLRAAWGIGERFTIGYSGNFGRAHEFATVLDAAERLRARPDILFLLIGQGHQRGWVEAEIERRGLTNVLLRPFQDEHLLAQSLGAADVHLVSLRPELEGFVVPSKSYAIAAAGRPMLFIGDPAGEIARLIAAHACGRTIVPGDADELARAIAALAAEPGLALSWGASARRAFELHFDRGIAVRAWQALLAGLATQPPGAAGLGPLATIRATAER